MDYGEIELIKKEYRHPLVICSLLLIGLALFGHGFEMEVNSQFKPCGWCEPEAREYYDTETFTSMGLGVGFVVMGLFVTIMSFPARQKGVDHVGKNVEKSMEQRGRNCNIASNLSFILASGFLVLFIFQVCHVIMFTWEGAMLTLLGVAVLVSASFSFAVKSSMYKELSKREKN